ncbi:glycosyltransferase family 10 domain-containing protein [Butyrivibrio fibrisolvens]|uniref:glycosyltransferase family 10 domain-containing protein n=1 Tax=Butyrivibrio fibrisolvens TaxID=831 RepID=UPI0003F99371|nr:glycosyltransferase family 10 [Butyrivibrio fibrisolvens]
MGNNSVTVPNIRINYIKNQIKRYIPSRISCFYKESVADSFLRKNRSLVTNYNYGEGIRRYFLYDACFMNYCSATKGRIPQYLAWDRYDYSLENHFYTDDLIFNKKWKPNKKYAIVMEPESLQPKKFKTLLRDKAFCREFEYIFTSNNELLMKIPNAKPLINGGVYIGTPYGGGIISDEQFKYKTKNISIVSSAKNLCALHRLRLQLANYYENKEEVDCFGSYNGQQQVKISDSLMNYRYSIVIENDIQDYWITEKICNCFATMTVPIYIGSPQIGKIFNSDGIIAVDKAEINSLDTIIQKCSKEDYEKRLPAIKDNFSRVRSYYCMEDWLIKEYADILP